MKIKAYTLMEVTVAMLLFAIVVSICYTAYNIVSTYYSSFHQKNETASDIISLRNVIENDFLKANTIIKGEDGFEVLVDTTKIQYSFTEQRIVRTVNTLRTDSFRLCSKDLSAQFESNSIRSADTIDQINFTLVIEKNINIPIQVNKHYSAKELFN